MKKYAIIPNMSVYMRQGRSGNWIPAMHWDKKLNGWVQHHHDVMSHIYSLNTKVNIRTKGLVLLSRIYNEKILYYENFEDMIRDRFNEFL